MRIDMTEHSDNPRPRLPSFSNADRQKIIYYCQHGADQQDAAFRALIARGNCHFPTPNPRLASSPLRLALLCAEWGAALALLDAGDAGRPTEHRDQEPCFHLAISGLLDHPDKSVDGLGATLSRLFLLGHSPNARGRHNESPFWRLLSSASQPPLPALQALLTVGVDPNEPRMEGGEPPLHYAAMSNQVDLLRLLLSFNASQEPFKGLSPLEMALKESQFDTAFELLKSPSQETLARRNKLGRGPLGLACENRPSAWRAKSRFVIATRESVALRLMDLGQDPLEPDALDETPLQTLRKQQKEDFDRLAEIIELRLATAGRALGSKNRPIL